jgi:hypothetical protein
MFSNLYPTRIASNACFKTDSLEDQGVGGRIILKRILKEWDGKASTELRRSLGQDREKWCVILNSVIKFRV